MLESKRAINVFFCYAREDEALLDRLKAHLTALQRQKLIHLWHDRNISAGAQWEQEIDKHLNSADIILLLISPDFMVSEYCYGIEMERAMERHERGEARVIPVILRSVYFKGAPFGKLQVLPTDAKSITGPGWHSQDEAFFNVAEGVRETVEELQLNKLPQQSLTEEKVTFDSRDHSNVREQPARSILTSTKQPLPHPIEPSVANSFIQKPSAKSESNKTRSALSNVVSWKIPSTALLNSPEIVKQQMYNQDTSSLAALIQDTLHSFRVDAEVREEDISIGPTIIRFGIRPTGKPEMMLDEKTNKMVPVRDAAGQIVYETRTRVSRIMALQNDLALVLEAKPIRMEAPRTGHPYIGVEIPNKNSRMVTLREVLESKEYVGIKAKSKLAVGLGKDVAGLVRVGNLSKMPNLLIAGATGSGKSVMINTIIASILTQATPDDVRLLMVDPKMVELNMYNGIPHLLSPVAVEVDKVVSLLKNGISEMERRYRLFSQLGVRNLDGYRKMRLERIAQGDLSLNNLPSIVIIIDELADLMMAAPEEVEGMICRLAQLAHATGIHLVVATQRPSVDVITDLIKANIPTRISFMVSSAVDSRTIIDMGGAERLLGRGDMLYLSADAGRPERIQGAFLSDDEAQKLADYWRQQIIEHAQALGEAPAEVELEDDLLEKAEEVVREYGRASISLLQRRLRIGYSRAARLIDLLEESGVIGHSETSGRAREVYKEGQISLDEANDIMDEERARNEFLRNVAARLQERRHHSPPVQSDLDS